ENAVKHNAVLEEKPLHIYIYTVEEKLIVENEVKQKSTPVFSTKMGLNNIRQKYKLLGLEQVQVEQTDSIFRVVIPLFKALQNEVSNSRR
ncbi:MAG TPA: hypothetical protein VM843_01135, partial [Flavisolibacter sp.]|nr:hypothetical protein [Flavisolibacter sp.]